MNIPGLNYYYHDTTISIIRDHQLIASIEEERLMHDRPGCAFVLGNYVIKK